MSLGSKLIAKGSRNLVLLFLFTSLAPSADLCDCILLGSLSPMSNTPDSLGLQFFALNETYVKDLLIEKREDEEPNPGVTAMFCS